MQGFAHLVPPDSQSRIGRLWYNSAFVTATQGQLAKRFYVSGMVQGVGYRFYVLRVASQLALSGYTRNLRDGRVEVYAIGSARQLAALRSELERGPRAAIVSEVAEQEASVEARYRDEFIVEHDSW
jgi:acylphosphatase